MQDSSTGSPRVLSRDECLTLLATAPIGRVVFTERALPAIQPVNFSLHGDEIIILTGEGSKLASVVPRTVVAFEADNVDAHTRTGWSVTVIGHSREVTDPADVARLRGLLASQRPVPGETFISIKAELVSGQRLDYARATQQLA